MKEKNNTPKNNNNNLFPIEIYPKELRNVIYNLNETNQHDLNYLALCYLINFSSVIKGETTLQAHCFAPERAIFYICIVCESGDGKSQVIKDTTDFIIKTQKELSNSEDDEGTCLFTTDITPEAIYQNHYKNDYGIFMKYDELTKLLNGFGKYSSGGSSNDKDNLNEIFNGDFSNNNRKGKNSFGDKKNSLSLSWLKVNLLSGVQSENAQYIFNKENNIDGFSCRFIISRPYSNEPKHWDINIDKSKREESIKTANKLIENVFNYKAQEHTLNAKATELFINWCNENEARYRFHVDRYEKKYNGKLLTLLIRTALTLHYIEGASNDKRPGILINETTIENAIKFIEWARIENRQIRVYQVRNEAFTKETEAFKEAYNNYSDKGKTWTEAKEYFTKIDSQEFTESKINTRLKKYFNQVQDKYYKTI